MRRVRPFLLATLVVLLVSGCAEEPRDPATPEGTLRLVFDAYDAHSPSRLYALLSPRSHELVAEARAGLGELKTLVESNVPLGPREAALEKAGVGLLDDIESDEQLFAALARMKVLDVDSGVVFGGGPVSKVVEDDGKLAKITSRSGDVYELVRVEDGTWRSRHLEEALERRLRPLRANLEAARAYAKGLAQRDAELKALLEAGPDGEKKKAEADAQSEGDDAAKATAEKKKRGKRRRRSKRRRRRRKKR